MKNKKRKSSGTLAGVNVRLKFANKFNKELHEMYKSVDPTNDPEIKMKIVKLARKHLNYSKKTDSSDILFGLYKLASSGE